MLREGCSDNADNNPVYQIEHVKQELFARDDIEILNDEANQVPPNLLEALGLGYDWYTENEWAVVAAKNNTMEQTVGMNEQMVHEQQNQYQMIDEFWLSDALLTTAVTNKRPGQLSFLKLVE